MAQKDTDALSFIVSVSQGFPGGPGGKAPAYQGRRHRRHGLDLWARKIPQRREWQTSPLLLPGESRRQRSWWAPVHVISTSRPRLKRLSVRSGVRGLGALAGPSLQLLIRLKSRCWLWLPSHLRLGSSPSPGEWKSSAPRSCRTDAWSP